MAAQDLAQQLITQQLFQTPTQQQKLQAYQNEKQMADALQAQGLQPIDTNNRMMGQIAYKISPMEGLAKIAQALTGAYEQKQAREDYGQIMQPDAPKDNVSGNGSADNVSGNQPAQAVNAQGLAGALGGGQSMTQMVQQLPPAAQRQYAYDMMAGDTRSATELVTSFFKPTDLMRNASDPRFGGSIIAEQNLKANPGQSAAQTAAGTAYGQNVPLGQAGQMLGGNNTSPAPQAATPQYTIDPMSGAMVPAQATPTQATPRQALPNPPPPSSFAPPQQSGNAPPTIDATTQAVKDQGGPGIVLSGNAPDEQTATVASPPPIDPTKTAAQNAAQLEAWKANQIAQGAVKPAGDKAQAEKAGENSAEAAKTLNVMAQNLPVLQSRIQSMSDANKSSTFGPWNDQAGDGLATKIQDLRNSPASIANAKLQQLTAQNVLPELGPALAQAGIKGNKFLETLSSTASGVDLGKGQQARQAQIDGLLNNYVQNMKSTYNQVKQYGLDPSSVFTDPQSVANAVKLGVIPREEGIAILQKNHGFK